MRNLSLLDKIITEVDHALKTIFVPARNPVRKNPADNIQNNSKLSDIEFKHIAGLIRVDHTGEICAQGLYRGQAMVAKLEITKKQLLQAANEEYDHLAWTQQRLDELESKTNLVNPFWYLGSFMIGASAGLISDNLSYGFVIETEHQVMNHLNNHLQQLPTQDKKSQAILQQMYIDEGRHAAEAKSSGGVKLVFPLRIIMKLQSKVMTKTAYYI